MRTAHFRPRPTTRPCGTTKAPTAWMPTRAGVCCPPTTFWTTGRKTILTRSRKAARTCRVSTRCIRAARNCSTSAIRKTFSSTAVNEFHFSYLRDANDLGKPVGGVGVSLASQGFEVGQGTAGIVPLSPKTEGVESVGFNSFTIGTNTNELKQVGNTFQWLDNFSKVIGHAHHQGRRGVPLRSGQCQCDRPVQWQLPVLRERDRLRLCGFPVGSSEPVQPEPASAFLRPQQICGHFMGRIAGASTRSLTLNYGLRWDRIEPWYEKYNQIATFVPGQQSVVFPGAPAGILYPTDPGVPRTLAPPGNRDFAPRIGLAYSPGASGDGLSPRYWEARARPASGPAMACFTPRSRRSRSG